MSSYTIEWGWKKIADERFPAFGEQPGAVFTPFG
jgi:hypothetical protein